jgi:hypothetical protein
MGDSELSASELRQRYNRGGTVKDDELTAAQLRARHGIPKNKSDFSTGSKDDSTNTVVIVVVALLVCGVIAYVLANQQ